MDLSIVKLLQYDGRMSFMQIAERLGVSESTVRRRIRLLSESGKLQVVGIVEPQELGWNEAAMIGIRVSPKLLQSATEEIAQLSEVSYLFQAAGEFDLFAEVYCRDKDHFLSFLYNQLQQISGVEHTQSFVILKINKMSYRWGESVPPDPQSPLKTRVDTGEEVAI